jgi:hypothetical protein
LCGAVRFEVEVPKAEYAMCHCGMCRRWSAGPFMSVHCPGPGRFTNDEGLAWYQGMPWAERGFCKKCGTSLFWRLAADPDREIVVSVEAFDEADDFTLDRHIYIDAKPARYDFADDRPRITEAELMKELGIELGEGS